MRIGLASQSRRGTPRVAVVATLARLSLDASVRQITCFDPLRPRRRRPNGAVAAGDVAISLSPAKPSVSALEDRRVTAPKERAMPSSCDVLARDLSGRLGQRVT